MIEYKTVAGRGSDEQTIEKSRFIAYVAPARTKEEADGFVAEIRTKHRDATHNVPAMVIGDKMQLQWGSDDGEPQGTSGAPIVQLLVKQGITDVVVVVTRYFGGIKLGPGGLVRAYTSSAKLGLAAAGICTVREMSVITARLDYTYLAKLQNLERSQGGSAGGGFDIADVQYADAVTVKLVSELSAAQGVLDTLANLTNATAVVLSQDTEMVKMNFSQE